MPLGLGVGGQARARGASKSKSSPGTPRPTGPPAESESPAIRQNPIAISPNIVRALSTSRLVHRTGGARRSLRLPGEPARRPTFVEPMPTIAFPGRARGLDLLGQSRAWRPPRAELSPGRPEAGSRTGDRPPRSGARPRPVLSEMKARSGRARSPAPGPGRDRTSGFSRRYPDRRTSNRPSCRLSSRIFWALSRCSAVNP